MLESDGDFTIVGEASNSSEAVILARQTLPDVILLDVAMPVLSGFEVLRQIYDVDKRIRPILLTAGITKDEIVHALQLGARGVLWKNSAAVLLCKSIRCVLSGQLWISRETFGDVVHILRNNPLPQDGILPACQQPIFTEALTVPVLQAQKTNLFEKPEAAISFNGPAERKFGLTARELEIVNAVVNGQSNREIAITYKIRECTVKHHLTRIFDKVGVYSRLELAMFAIRHNVGGHLRNMDRSA
jgi:DNA-binding NarL/FixJ family response regulator